MTTTTFVDEQTVIEAPWCQDVNDHVYGEDTTAHPASSIVNTPAGTIVATDVQAAINELDTEKEALTNKSTTLVADLASDTKYPSVKSVYDWVVGFFVGKTSATGSAKIPARTTVQRDVDTPAVGFFGYNVTTNQFEGYGSSGWGKVGGGTTGGGTDAAFYENDCLITTDYTIGQSTLISGATVTIATPGVVTLTAHGYTAGQLVFFQTTGALPTGLVADYGYYVISTGLTADAFQLSLTDGGAAINTTGSQSGVHSCGKIKNAQMAGNVTFVGAVTIPVNSTLVIN